MMDGPDSTPCCLLLSGAMENQESELCLIVDLAESTSYSEFILSSVGQGSEFSRWKDAWEDSQASAFAGIAQYQWGLLAGTSRGSWAATSLSWLLSILGFNSNFNSSSTAWQTT